MLIHLACLISIVVPQAPAGGPEGDADAAIAHARTLPPDTLAAVSLHDVARAAKVLGESDFYEGLAETVGAPLPDDPAAFLRAWSRRAAAATELPEEQWSRLLGGRLTFAVTELRSEGGAFRPGWLLVADVGQTGPWSAALERLAAAAGSRVEPIQLEDGGAAWSVRVPDGPGGAWTFTSGGLLLAADSAAALAAARARAQGRGGRSLADVAQARAFAARVAASEAQVVCFVRTSGLIQLASMRVSPGQAAQVRRVLAGLGLDALQSVGFALRLRRHEVEEIAWLGLPAPRDGLLGTLLASGEPLDATDADAIPLGVASFSIVQIPLGEVVQQALDLVRGSDPMTSGMVDRGLATMRSRTGVDPQSDLLDLLGPRIVQLQWETTVDGESQSAVMIQIAREPDRLTTALTRVSKALPVPVRRRQQDTATIFSLGEDDAGAPVLAVTPSHLVVATSAGTLQRVLQHLHGGRPDPRARRILGDLGPGTTWVSWAQEGLLESAARRAFEAVPARGGLPRSLARSITALARRARGPYQLRLEVDRHGIAVRTRAPFSHVLAAAAIGIGSLRYAGRPGAGPALERAPAIQTFSDPVLQPEPGRRHGDRRLYEAILAAEQGKGTTDPILEGLRSTDARIVARAAYAAGKRKLREAVQQLGNLVENHPALQVRRHAMAALLAIKDPRTVECSLRALESDDATLRALGAANLGRLRHRAAAEALVDVVGASTDPEAPDRVQAVLALADLGDPGVLLTVAASVETDGKPLDQALAYLLQTLSPKLGQEEVKTLMAVLDHPSTVVRRYAIQRLGQLRDPICVRALEGRLGKEGDTLRPLIEVSLQAVRGASVSGAGDDAAGALDGARKSVRGVLDRVRSFVRGSSDLERAAMVGGFFLLTIGGAGLLLWRDRRRRRREAEQWAALVAPSEGFEDGEQAAYEEAGEPHEFDEGEPAYVDEEVEPEAYEGAEFVEGYEEDAGEEYAAEGEQADEDAAGELESAPSLHDEFGPAQDDVLEVPLAADDDIAGEPDLLRRDER